MSSGPSFCWVCRRPLEAATTGVNAGWLVFSVVVDPINNEHRTHKKCGSQERDRDGEKNPWRWVRNEKLPRVEL